MKRQEAFTIAYQGILAQGGPAFDGDRCFYRAPNGSKCAAGQLIPDDKYDPSIEGQAAWSHPVRRYLPKGLDGDFLGALQKLHDNAASDAPHDFIATFKERAVEFARVWNLKVPE